MSEEKNIKQQVNRILEDGDRIREGVSQLLLSVIRETGFQAKQVKNSVGEIIEGLGSYIKEKGEAVDEQVVEEVIEGVGDAVEAGLNATSLAFEEAKGSGQEFAKDEVNRLHSDFVGLKDIVVEVLGSTAKSLKSVSQSAARNLDSHIQRTAERIEPAIQSSLETLKNHPLELSKGIAGTMFSAIGTALQSVGEELQGSRKSKDVDEELRKK